MKDNCQQARGLRVVDEIARDLKHLFRPLSFPAPNRLTVSVYATRERPSEPAVFVLYRDYLRWKERNRPPWGRSLGLGLWISRMAESMLFGVEPRAPLVFAGTAVTLTAVGSARRLRAQRIGHPGSPGARADPDLTPENARCSDSYPARSVASGSAFAARRDGTRHASKATPASRKPAMLNTAGSLGLTPTRKPAVSRARPDAASAPSASPSIDSTTPRPSASRMMAAEVAPRADRMPNSCFRWTTACDTTP